MNTKSIRFILGWILNIEALLMLLPVATAVVYREEEGIAYALVMAVCAAVGALMTYKKPNNPSFYAKEGFVCTALGWILMSAFGCVPFMLTGEIPSFVDAMFEMVSGFTTTGASVVLNVEELSHCTNMWRCFSHWIGGMGILVFLLAFTPTQSGGGHTMHLLRAESPGPSVGKLTPRLHQTAKILYILYFTLTVLDLVFLLLGGMPLFDALCTAFGTAGTGGFGVKADSIAGYSPYLQNVTTVFMLLFGVNFTVYYLVLVRHTFSALLDEELRLYLAFFAGSTLLITWNVRGMYRTLGETVRHAAFQVSSIMTTTGFATTDFNLWPSFSKAIILMLMLLGACAGSTGGGLKMARVLLLLKDLRRSVRKSLHPNSVQVVQVNGEALQEQVLRNTAAYLTAYCILTLGSFLLVSLDGFSVEANISAVFACFNNIGPGLAEVGPTSSFAAYSAFSKVILTMDMLFGRLEIFPMLALLSRHTWRRSL